MIKMDEVVDMLVGNATADSEHLELLLLINLLYSYSSSKKYIDQIPSLVVLFTAKLLAHCQSEEKILQELNSSTLDAHRKEHQQMVSTTISMLDNITIDTVKNFEVILKNHICKYDIVGFSS